MVFSNVPSGAIAPGSCPPCPGSSITVGMVCARARLGSASPAAAALAAALAKNPNRRRVIRQFSHMTRPYHAKFNNGFLNKFPQIPASRFPSPLPVTASRHRAGSPLPARHIQRRGRLNQRLERRLVDGSPFGNVDSPPHIAFEA